MDSTSNAVVNINDVIHIVNQTTKLHTGVELLRKHGIWIVNVSELTVTIALGTEQWMLYPGSMPAPTELHPKRVAHFWVHVKQ